MIMFSKSVTKITKSKPDVILDVESVVQTSLIGKHKMQFLLTQILSWTSTLQSSTLIRSSHHKCSIIKAALEHFAMLTGKHLCWSLFFEMYLCVIFLPYWHFASKPLLGKVSWKVTSKNHILRFGYKRHWKW